MIDLSSNNTVFSIKIKKFAGNQGGDFMFKLNKELSERISNKIKDKKISVENSNIVAGAACSPCFGSCVGACGSGLKSTRG